MLGLPEAYCFSRRRKTSGAAVISNRQRREIITCQHCTVRKEQIQECGTSSTNQVGHQDTAQHTSRKGKEPSRSYQPKQQGGKSGIVIEKTRRERLLQTFNRLTFTQGYVRKSNPQGIPSRLDTAKGKGPEVEKRQDQVPLQCEKSRWSSTWDTVAVALSHGAMMPV